MNNDLSTEVWKQLERVTGESRADLCVNLSYREFQNSNYEAAQILCGTALDIYFNLDVRVEFQKILDAYKGITNSLKHLGKFQEAAVISLDAATYLKPFDSNEHREAIGNAADCFYYAGDYQKALNLFFAIFQDPMNIFDDGELARIYKDIAFCYTSLAQYSEAIDFFIKARQLFVINQEPRRVAFIDEEISECYEKVKNGTESYKYAQLALDFAILMNDKERLAYSHSRMGFAKILTLQLDSALSHLKRSKQLILEDKLPNWGFVVQNEKGIAHVLHLQGKVKESEATYKRIESIISSTGDTE
jgi:tetratricopeptide (TPR) repeat protein